MPKRQLKGQGKFTNIKGVGLPAQLRFSVTKRYQFWHQTTSARTTVIWNLGNPFVGPITNGTLVTTIPIPEDLVALVNMFTYRRFAVYAVSMVEIVRAVNQATDISTNEEATVGVTTTPSGTGQVVPLNFQSLSDQDFDRYMTYNNRSRTYKVSKVNGNYSIVTIKSEFENHEILGVDKSQIYEPNFAGMITATATYVQPANQAANANPYVTFRVTGIYPSQVDGFTGNVNTPSEVASPACLYDCQITYHMLLFNDVANDQAIGTPGLDEEGNAEEMEDGEWSEDDQKTFTKYQEKLSNSLKKIKMSQN